MLACHVEWHMRRRLVPILPGEVIARSPSAEFLTGPRGRGVARRQTEDVNQANRGLPSGPQLRDVARRPFDPGPQHRPGGRKKRDVTFDASAIPTAVQKRALELLGVDTTVAGGTARGMQTASRFNPASGRKNRSLYSALRQSVADEPR